jgi:hypothetical protein
VLWTVNRYLGKPFKGVQISKEVADNVPKVQEVAPVDVQLVNRQATAMQLVGQMQPALQLRHHQDLRFREK